MNDEKPWYEKLGIWIGIIASVFTILGITIFSDKSLIKDNKDANDVSKEFTPMPTSGVELTPEPILTNTPKPTITSTPKPTLTNTPKPILTNTPKPTITQTPVPTLDSEETNNSVSLGTPFVVSNPKQSAVINANLSRWDEEKDRDIIGNTYDSAMKLSVSNFINAIGGGSSHIIADVHIPLGGKVQETWIVSFVVAKDMVGNGSSADVTILSEDEPIFETFTIDSVTTDELIYEINLTDIRDLVISFDCNSVDSGFCVGIILESKVKNDSE